MSIDAGGDGGGGGRGGGGGEEESQGAGGGEKCRKRSSAENGNITTFFSCFSSMKLNTSNDMIFTIAYRMTLLWSLE